MELVQKTQLEISDAEELFEKIKEYIHKAKSAETRKAYRSDWRDFEKWCQQNGFTAMPAQTATVAAYLADIARTKKVATIERRLVSIRQAHNMSGSPLDKNDVCIKETLKGIKNTHGKPQDAKAPILTKDLREMVQRFTDKPKDVRDRALLIVGFTGAFRRSEIVSINVEDISFKKEGVEIVLRRSKTDQEGQGTLVPIPYGSNPQTCPVRAVKEWLEISKITSGPLFRAVNRHGQISESGMCAYSVSLIVKNNPYIKEKRANYSAHSLRAGFCTQAAANGVSDTQGMRQSRHKKFDTWRKYVRFATVWQDSAATKLGL